MSPPISGVYNIVNVGSGKLIDVEASGITDGTRIIAFTLNNPPSNNQQWRLIPQSWDGVIVTLQSRNAQGYIFAPGAAQGTKLVQSLTPVAWKLIPAGDDKFRIGSLQSQDSLVLSFPPPANSRDPLVLQKENSSDANQLWQFKPVIVPL